MIKNGKITPVDPYLFNLAQPISIPPKKTVNIQHHTSNFQPHTSNVQRPTSHSTIMCANHKNPRHQRSPYYIIQHHTSDPPPIGGQASHRRNDVPSTSYIIHHTPKSSASSAFLLITSSNIRSLSNWRAGILSSE